MTSTSVKKKSLPPGLVSNLQEVLSKKGGGGGDGEEKDQPCEAVDSAEPTSSTPASEDVDSIDSSKPIVLVTNGDGIDSPGVTYLVEALVAQGLYNVQVCAPQLWVICN